MKLRIRNSIIELIQGDITESETSAIVNAANSSLILGAGVAGAIKNKGGPDIQKECNIIGFCPVGGAVLTTGGNLKAHFIIHAVGPRMGEGDEEIKLKNATFNSLRKAEEHQLSSITFPAISTGIFGFPVEKCAKIMLSEVYNYLQEETRLKKVCFALYDSETLNTFKKQLDSISH